MKVCPYCSGIAEEKNAVKCDICGKQIKDEPEYTKEELADELIMSEIKQQILKRKNKEKGRKFGFMIVMLIAIIIALTCFFIFQPKGHIELNQTSYITKVGQQLEIDIVYHGNITSKNVKLKIISTDSPQNPSFRYQFVDDKLIINPIHADYVIIELLVRDDGKQQFYNNKITITITN